LGVALGGQAVGSGTWSKVSTGVNVMNTMCSNFCHFSAKKLAKLLKTTIVLILVPPVYIHAKCCTYFKSFPPIFLRHTIFSKS
jgi:hypothetical protein